MRCSIDLRAMLNCKAPDGSEDADAKKSLADMRTALHSFIPEAIWNAEKEALVCTQKELESAKFDGDKSKALAELDSVSVCGMQQHTFYCGIENSGIGNIRLQVTRLPEQFSK